MGGMNAAIRSPNVAEEPSWFKLYWLCQGIASATPYQWTGTGALGSCDAGLHRGRTQGGCHRQG